MSSHTSSSLPSAPSTLSVATTTTCASSTSTTPLKQSPTTASSKPKKDYAAAFSTLQTQYGWGHVTYVPVESKEVKAAQEKKRAEKERKALEKAQRRDAKAASSASSSSNASSDQPPRKDYESAFGALSSKMGFGGGSWAASSQRKQ